MSLLNDAASEMVVPLLPALLATLGAGGIALGAVEGSAEAVASVLKYVSGRGSDRIGRTLPLVIPGYGLAALVRPFLAVVTAPWQVLTVRVLDRVGKGLRTAPRDALIAGSVPEADRGAAFGLHRSMDHAGAVIGPLLALLVLWFWPEDLRRVFLFALIPGLLSVAVLLAVVREPTHPPTPPAARAVDPVRPQLWRLLVPVGLGTLGTASDTFLMLAAGVRGSPLMAVPLLWVGLHAVRVVSSGIGGGLADRYGPRRAVAVGWAWRSVCLAALAVAVTPVQTASVVLAFGVAGMAEPGEKKLVAARVGEGHRGGAYGTYHLVVGLAALPASLGFGVLWDWTSPATAFGVSAALVAIASVLLWILLRE